MSALSECTQETTIAGVALKDWVVIFTTAPHRTVDAPVFGISRRPPGHFAKLTLNTTYSAEERDFNVSTGSRYSC
jgi:hypothetical protein